MNTGMHFWIVWPLTWIWEKSERQIQLRLLKEFEWTLTRPWQYQIKREKTKKKKGWKSTLWYQLFGFTVYHWAHFYTLVNFRFGVQYPSGILFSNKRGCDTDKWEYCNPWYLIEHSNRNSYSSKFHRTYMDYETKSNDIWVLSVIKRTQQWISLHNPSWNIREGGHQKTM